MKDIPAINVAVDVDQGIKAAYEENEEVKALIGILLSVQFYILRNKYSTITEALDAVLKEAFKIRREKSTSEEDKRTLDLLEKIYCATSGMEEVTVDEAKKDIESYLKGLN